ncbi:DUF3348 domain-containing protein [Bordetella sp. BOR01]|uniref:DUF3348 domain-containing protein n=1 Tax=Bordetella sp. BOR01 TaxID=2854779 RepID=UPI001C445685|nr:DUF3348 domain-containing protein [Bordetella sp. BOR01]MBV7483936.1 DUF3348 domain-containing protein [Bordetella sp. BOR01]
MVQVPRRTGVSGPTLIRLLARLTDADIPQSRQSLADRLSLWLGWTDAIALSTVLDAGPPAVAASARISDSAEKREYERVRSTLAHAIADDRPFIAARPRAPALAQHAAPGAEAGYATYRQRYRAVQQAMETSIAKLRGRLRALLAAQTPAMARLAMVDAIMERSLSLHERRLLGTIPAMLEAHFERLRQAAQDTPEADAQAAEAPATAAPAPWLIAFRADMRSVLRAELDIRLQPIEGLLAALRAN